MTLNSTLPGLQQLVIIVLLGTDTPLVLDFSKLGSALFIHAILQVTAHRAVSLSYLAEHIPLVSFALEGVFERTFFMHTVKAINFIVDLTFFVRLKPFSLFLKGLLQQNVSFTILIDVLHQVDTSLIFTTPLLLSGIPLLVVFNCSKIINNLFFCLLVRLNVLVVNLKSANFFAASISFICFPLLDGALFAKCYLKQCLVAHAISLLGLLAKLLFCGVVGNQLKIALSIQ